MVASALSQGNILNPDILANKTDGSTHPSQHPAFKKPAKGLSPSGLYWPFFAPMCWVVSIYKFVNQLFFQNRSFSTQFYHANAKRHVLFENLLLTRRIFGGCLLKVESQHVTRNSKPLIWHSIEKLRRFFFVD